MENFQFSPPYLLGLEKLEIYYLSMILSVSMSDLDSVKPMINNSTINYYGDLTQHIFSNT